LKIDRTQTKTPGIAEYHPERSRGGIEISGEGIINGLPEKLKLGNFRDIDPVFRFGTEREIPNASERSPDGFISRGAKFGE
jgi:hypothetical protein